MSTLIDEYEDRYRARQEALAAVEEKDYEAPPEASLNLEQKKLLRTAEEVTKKQSSPQCLVLKDSMTLELEFQTEEIAKKRNTWNYDRQGATLILETSSGLAMLDDIIRVAYYSRKTWPFRRIFGVLRRWIDGRSFL